MNDAKYNYRRRPTQEVNVADVGIGGTNRIRIQTMANLSTNDIEGCVAQTLRVARRGGELLRVTTQGVREADSAGEIRKRLRAEGCAIPVVADVHFNPNAAMRAAETVDKVRINPGNFVDAARTFRKLEYTDEEYKAELDKIRRALLPFLDKCKANSTAVRLGVNHGSLSDRIMSRYGDTPAGMVESVMEYLRISREAGFNDIVISIKASSTAVMVSTVKLLVAKMDEEDMHYPLHLGVTEAGDGEDGRVKSAVGIGALLAEGIGDTIRVSLSEEPEDELPVAACLRDIYAEREAHAPIEVPATESDIPTRDRANKLRGFERVSYPVVPGYDTDETDLSCHRVDASNAPALFADDNPVVLSSSHINPVGEMQSWIERFVALGGRNPIILYLKYDGDTSADEVRLRAAADLGAMLLNGHGSGIMIESPALSAEETTALSLGILQAAGLRVSKTEFISCPGCGRTLFDLQNVVKEVKEAFSHLKGLKIGVMGCIVNGPGEMADAHYGYVGAAAGKVSLYKGKTCIEKNIPQEEAIARLKDIIKANGDWQEP